MCTLFFLADIGLSHNAACYYYYIYFFKDHSLLRGHWYLTAQQLHIRIQISHNFVIFTGVF